VAVETSILKTVKSALGLDVTDTSFDAEVILFTNTVLATLNQIGVGPEAGFQIVDAAATWDNLLGTDLRLNNVQTYIYTKVRLLFDPPQSAKGVEAMETVAKELEIRIYLAREAATWVPPAPDPLSEDDDFVLDGGML
jgi:hypothetical protein